MVKRAFTLEYADRVNSPLSFAFTLPSSSSSFSQKFKNIIRIIWSKPFNVTRWINRRTKFSVSFVRSLRADEGESFLSFLSVAKLTARIRMHIKYGDIDPRVSRVIFTSIRQFC